MFSDTIRDNLDPFEEFDDTSVWRALEDASLKDAINPEDGLDMPVDENGANFSVGQRQMIGIARALLKRPKVIIMDEATANVDVETDASIQRAMRTRFAGCTCITIARKYSFTFADRLFLSLIFFWLLLADRINTIIDADKILVMDAGRVAEFDAPQALLTQPTSHFYALVNENEGAHSGSS